MSSDTRANNEMDSALVKANSDAAARTCCTTPRCEVDSCRGASDIAMNKSPVRVAAASATTVKISREAPRTMSSDLIR